MTIQLQGYETFLEDRIYSRPAESVAFKKGRLREKISASPHLVLTTLSRARIPTREEIIGYIVQCAKGQRDELKHLMKSMPQPDLFALASRDPSVISRLADYISIPESMLSGENYLFVNNHLVPKESLDKLESSNSENYTSNLMGFVKTHSGISWRIQSRFADWDCLDINEFDPLLKGRVYDSASLRVTGYAFAVDYSEISGQVRALCQALKDSGYESLDNSSKRYASHIVGETFALFHGVAVGQKIGNALASKLGLQTPSQNPPQNPGSIFPGSAEFN